MNRHFKAINRYKQQNRRSSMNTTYWSKSFFYFKPLVFICIVKSLTMKKLITNSNPFILLLAPVMFALIMGVSYQFQQKKFEIASCSAHHATSLFLKGVNLVKTVCAISKEKLW